MGHNPRMTTTRTPTRSADASVAAMRSIGEAERDSGLPRATIRMWERRYGFPAPARDERGERCYPDDQVLQLRLMKRLVDLGYRPAKLLALGPLEMQRLHDGVQPRAAARKPRVASHLLTLLRSHDAAAVESELRAQLERVGLARFAGAEVPAMNRAVGEAWQAGELEVHEEHLYSDCLAEILRPAIAQLRDTVRPEAPTVLLTTFPHEHHGIGLLIAQALLAAEGCNTISLGVRLPLDQIVAAARAHDADLVGLSFSGSTNANHVLRGLEELRGALPPQVRIWAGGSASVLLKRKVAGVRMVPDALAIPALLAEDFALAPRTVVG
jgi:DNA-binding transcriptional MerR regulator/methylmalonyl-CoA mutase cobalamin-binding subunit